MYPEHKYHTNSRKIPIRGVKNGIIMEKQNNNDDNDTTIRPDNPAGATRPINGKVEAATDETDWQAVALRLQADMDNFRKRQTRRADEVIALERERLLQRILPVADNLARALRHHFIAS